MPTFLMKSYPQETERYLSEIKPSKKINYLISMENIYLFVFPDLITLSILHTEKLHCCGNITS